MRSVRASGDTAQPGEELVGDTTGSHILSTPAESSPPGRLDSDLAAQVYAALDTVRDPELDESIVSLKFVSSVAVSAGDGPRSALAEVHLRLPTYFCAPNFAFLMVADAYDATMAVPGVSSASVLLDDHFASSAINGGVAAQAGFQGTFSGEAENELDELRANFLRKAVLAGQDRVARPLLSRGWSPERLADATLGEPPDSADLRRLRHRRALLGLPAGDQDPLLVEADGTPVTLAGLPLHLRRARTTRVGMEANGEYCRGLLADRYNLAEGGR